jgi:hypothetical protein
MATINSRQAGNCEPSRTCFRGIRLDDCVLREAGNQHKAHVTCERHIPGLERKERCSRRDNDEHVGSMATVEWKNEVRHCSW